MSHRITRPASWLAVAAVAATVAACGSSSNSSSPGAATASSSVAGVNVAGVYAPAAALVPASVKSKGTVIVAADATYAPNEFIGPDGHTVIGMDADLAKSLFPLLGLKPKIVNATFDTIIPGLQSGKFDIGMSSFTDTKAREQVVNFVDYFTAGESFFENASGGPKVSGALSEICGLTVAVESGTTEESDAQNQSKKCTAEGKKPVNVLVYPDQNSANLALASGRAQLGFADSPVAAYQVKQSDGKFKLVGTSIENAPYGIAVPKSYGNLDQALLTGLKFLISSGQYHTILKKWGVQAGALNTPTINGATS